MSNPTKFPPFNLYIYVWLSSSFPQLLVGKILMSRAKIWTFSKELVDFSLKLQYFRDCRSVAFESFEGRGLAIAVLESRDQLYPISNEYEKLWSQ